MIGTQRSGSNLFRLMLNQLPQVASPHPPHIITRLMPLVPSYGDLGDSAAFALLVHDACRLVESNPVEWEGVRLDRADIARRCAQPHLFAVMAAIYDVLTETWGKQQWVCKSLGNVAYAEELAAFFPDANFIYLYRDGRDVALSFTRAIEGEKNAYSIAADWDAAQQQALRLGAKLPAERFLRVSYEHLTGDAKATLQRTCAFLSVPYSDDMLEFHSSSEAQKAASSSNLWGNVTKPVMQENTRKFLKETSKDDLRIFESVAGRSLDELGYERFALDAGKEDTYAPEQIEAFREDNARKKAAAWDDLPAEDRERRHVQQALIAEIKSRNAARMATV